MNSLSSLKLFATHPHTCSYLPQQEATTLFVDPTTALDVNIYSQLSDIGFRRSGEHLYRPHCASCNACVPVRIPVQRFQLSRAQKRCLQRNANLRIRCVNALNPSLHYPLYAQYIEQRHQDGDMYPPSLQQLTQFLGDSWAEPSYLEFWLQDELLAVAVSDRLVQGLSAIYTFYTPAPEQDFRSLGVLAVLAQIERAAQLDLPYVYLGYWIKNCRKMAYKTQYTPLEYWYNQAWHPSPP